MSFFGALYTGTAGLLAQERATNHTSENIANVSTVGYKRMDTAFHELVSQNKSDAYSHNSVGTTRINRIDQPGSVQQTDSVGDVAIIGDGFFAVRETTTNPDERFLYTRNGSFSADNEGVLRNSAGFALYGWEISNGVVASGPDTASLVPVDIDILADSSIPTTEASIALNLDANETPYNPHLFGTPQQLPVSTQGTHFTRGLSVFDANGTERRLNFEFRAITGPMAHFSSQTNAGTGGLEVDDILAGNPAGSTPLIADGDTLVIDDGTNALTVTMRAGTADLSLNEAQTVENLLDVINSYAPGGTQLFTATLDSNDELLVQANDPAATIDISTSSATVLGAGGLNIVQDPDVPADYIYEPDADILADGTANPNQTTFPTFADSATPNPFHWWEMRITIADPANPTGSTQVELSKGLINFDGSGSLNATLDADGQALIDLGDIDFDAADATESTSISLNIASLTQFGGDYNVISEDQNGTGLGTYQGFQITRDGIVQSIFTNGQRLDSYQIPLANFTNVNGLERISGTAFAETEESGMVTINDANTGGVGQFNAASLENSNVDIGQEFSHLIVSQRAFSLNSRVITTVDEMTEQLAQLKR